jgi:fatty-acyl-CoA synthase
MSASEPGEPYIARLAHVLARSDVRACLRHEGHSVTARDLLTHIYRYARVLSGLGLGRGDIVALIAPICPDALAVRYAANLLGAGATFLSVPAKPEDRARLIATIDPRLLVVFPDTAALVPADVAAPIASIGATPIHGLRLDDIARGVSDEPLECRAQPADLAVVVSSGGSTGVPKGSWRDFAAYTAMVTVPSSGDRRQLINGPLAYLSQVLVDITLLGGGTVIMRDRYDAVDTLRTIASERITDVFLVEPQLFELMDHPDLASTDLSSLRTVTHIGATAPPTLRLRAREKLGPRIAHTYGASEEGLVSILTAAEDDPADSERFHSAGRPLPQVKIRFRKEDGTFCKPGESVLIEVRSPAMAQGYRNRPDLEDEAFRDGWYRSETWGASTTTATCTSSDGPSTSRLSTVE